MIEFGIDLLINFITFGVCFLPLYFADKSRPLFENIAVTMAFIGLVGVGTGIFISSSEEINTYVYIILIIQICALSIDGILILWKKRFGNNTFLILISILTSIVSMILYIYYVVASFIY